MSWCKVCGRYHLFGACTITVESDEQAWEHFRRMLRRLTRPAT